MHRAILVRKSDQLICFSSYVEWYISAEIYPYLVLLTIAAQGKA